MDDKTIARFWSKVDRRGPDDCWPWRGTRNAKGYGMFLDGRRWIGTANHVALVIHLGRPLGLGMQACHSCDTRYPKASVEYRACANPAHLWEGTNGENQKDAFRKGRQDFRGEGCPRARLREAQVVAIRERYADGAWADDLAREFGVANVTIKMIVCGRIWASVGGPRTLGRSARRNHKITREQAERIRERRAAGERGSDLAREFGITRGHVCSIYKRHSHAQ